MKNILWFISLSLMFLLGAESMNGTPSVDEGVGVESILQADASMDYILPVVPEFPDDCEAYSDTESLAHQLRTCGRGQRPTSVQQLWEAKSSAYRIAKRHFEDLFHSVYTVYTTLPCQSWAVASDHYVFGMRRILI